MRDDRKRLAAEVRGTVPPAPGVYAFLDGGGRLLYVGKSLNLRKRMGSYFGRNPLTAEPGFGQLVASIRSFAWWQTRSELLALLMEDVLIKEHLPPSNTRQREMPENRYLELTDDAFPACLIVEHVPDFGERDVFGPMKDKYFAGSLREVLGQALGIRTCRSSEPNRRCLEYDLGRCAGPCRDAVGAGEYAELVARARDFLRGDVEEVVDRLVRARDRAAETRRFEDAARLRDAIDTCRRYGIHERFARRFLSEDCEIVCDRDGIEYRFERGALVSPRTVIVARGQSEGHETADGDGFRPEEAGREAVAALHQLPSADRRILTDRARIVCNWAHRQGVQCRARPSGSEAPSTTTLTGGRR
jgi:excinuclease UvrABC nuclease subunit